jgi:hypothetical protein
LVLLAAPHLAFGYGAGITGYSGITPKMDCNVCHSGGPVPKVTVAGPTTLAAGTVGKYTATAVVSAAGRISFVGGIDVAADNANAVLGVETTTTEVRSGEVTHNQGLPYTKAAGGTYTLSIPFTMKAPASAGTVTIYLDMLAGAGQAAPTPDYGTLATVKVTITGTATGGVDGGVDGGSGGGSTGGGSVDGGAGGAGGNTGGAPPPASGGMDNGGTGGADTTGGAGDPNAMMTPPNQGCSFGNGALSWPAFLVFAALLVACLRRRAS